MLVIAPAPAAPNAEHEFAIAPQSLSSALLKFSKQADLQVIVASRIVGQRDTVGAVGDMTIEQALGRLLDGTGLTYELLGGHSVRVVTMPAAALSAPAATIVTAATQTPGEVIMSASYSPDFLEEVIVTARRKEESVQDVPIVVNVFSQETLAAQDIRTFTDLERMVPAVSTCCGRGSVNAFTYIRGVNSAVGYFAEVPTSLNGNALFFDVGNVQVLKGPQGTLFGIATNGGAILYEPRRPSAEFEGYGSVTTGSYGRSTVEGVVNLPISDRLQVRLGAVSQHMDGYIRDVTTEQMLGTEDYWTARLSVLARPTARLTNYSVLNYYSSDRVPEPLGVPYGPNAGINPDGPAAQTFAGPELDAWIQEQRSLGRYAIVGNSVVDPRVQATQLNFVNTTDFDITPQLRLRNIAGYVQNGTRSVTDTDGTPFPIIETSEPTEFSGPTRQYTEEMQLQGNALDRKLSYVVGSFNRWTRQSDPQIAYQYSLGRRAGTLSEMEGDTTSLFAEGSYQLPGNLKDFSVTGGYRYTRDERMGSQARFDENGSQVSSFSADGVWERDSYRWGLTYERSPHLMVYFMNSKGYTAGGFNLTAPPQYQKYDPEILDNYEIGFKSDWKLAGRPGRANMSFYYGKWDNMQVQVTSRCDTATGPTFCQLTRNAATGQIKGFEGELAINPLDSLELFANFGFMQGNYTNFYGLTPTGECCVDLSRVPFLYIPEWKYSLTARWRLPFDQMIGKVTLSAAYSHTDDINSIFTLGPPRYWNTSPDMQNLNLSLNWDAVMNIPRLSLSAIVTNVTQNETLQAQWGVYETLGQYARSSALPRMWSLQLRYNF